MSIVLEGTLEIEGDKPDGDFEREGGKIVRRSQANVIHAIHKLDLRFESDEMFDGDVQVTRPDGSTFYVSQEFALRKLHLELDRRFGFRPAWAYFRIVFLDYMDRLLPSERRAPPMV